ncbi:MAG: cytochrome c biogenesis protein CcdA [Acidimicrobiia bacterium]|nr:cytochrome c biogenesis protein CcdA [Acidimicrobiia bacterium]
MSAALALAFGAGMVATVNPCGFAMLPAYLSYFMGIQDEGRSRPAVLRSALIVGGVVSLGFLVVFGIAGVIISAISTTVASDWLPWLALLVGLGLIGLGVAMLRGYELKVGLPRAGRASTVRSYRNIFAFGTSYAVASLSCTLPVFLTLIATQFSRRSFAEGLLLFGVYAAGMATVLLAVTVVLALGKHSLVTRLRGAGAYINRISGALLVVAGVWIVWFWTTSLTSGAAELSRSASFRFVEDLSQSIINFTADNKLTVGLALAVFVATAAAVAFRGRADVSAESVEETPLEV